MRAWDQYLLARHPARPSPRWFASALLNPLFELHGDRTGADDPAAFGAIARFDGRPIAVASFDRASPSAAGFRKLTRVIETAGRLRIPIVTLIDTPGADPSPRSEYSGLAYAIARTFETLLFVPTPVVAITTGEGGSGGALALACGDIVGILEHAVFSVIGPEGAAEILYRDPSRAQEVAPLLRPTAKDLLDLGLADAIVPEPGAGAHEEPQEAARSLGEWLAAALRTAAADPLRRRERFARHFAGAGGPAEQAGPLN